MARTIVRASRRQRRRSAWTEENALFSTAVGVTSLRSLLADYQTFTGRQLEGITVVRLVGWIKAETLATETSWGIVVGGDGETTVSLDPEANRYRDWMAKGYLHNGVVEDRSGGSAFHRFDIRSKRKMTDVGQDLILAIRSVAGTSSTRFHVRALVLLP